MSKFSIKKLFVFLCLPLLSFAVVFSSLLMTETIKRSEVANASIEYVNSSNYINKLAEKSDFLQSSYSLDEYYPIMAENQTDSDLCWIYSSQKVLETALMKQKNEYHNFSEIGSALTYYIRYTLNGLGDGEKFINTTGNFARFNMIAQNIGLIYESNFSNDIYLDLTEENYKDYSYILDHIDTSVMQNVKPINIHDDLTYISASSEKKLEILKRYILQYGGIFAGIEQGVISCDNNVYFQQNNPQKDNENDGYVGLNHAVCIVGWNDEKDCGSEYGKGAFRVLNSWGVSSKSFNYFWVPYSYSYIYTDTYGYICEGENKDIVLSNTSADSGETFSNKFMISQDVNLSNMFLYNQDVSLSYKISTDYDFDKIFVNVYQGMTNETHKFSVDFNDDENIVTISANDKSVLGEGYVIEFYNDQEFLASKDFYVFTGTEVSYIELVDETVRTYVDSTLFNNTLASSEFEQTYYIYDNSGKSYYLNFYLPGLRGYEYDRILLSLGDVKIYSTDENGNVVEQVSNNSGSAGDLYVTIEQNQQTIKNRSRVKIANLARKNVGKVVEINIDVLSRESKGTGKVQTYKFIFFVSSNADASTKNANSIVYELDGGENNLLNVHRYPSYEKETNASKFKLFDPTKYTSTFLGWYLDADFTKPITEIDSSLVGDIVIYARWESKDAVYFDLSLNLSEIKDYFNVSEKYTGQDIIYGDSVKGEFTFVPEFDQLQTYKYYSKYEFYVNGKLFKSGGLSEIGDTIYFSNTFLDDDGKPSLVCGEYNWQVKVTMLVSHQFSITKEAEVEFTIKQKQVTANFDKNTLSYVYDKQEHIPSVSSFEGVYAEDGMLSYEFNRGSYVNVGEYTYKVISIDNENYFIDDQQECTLKITRKPVTITWKNLKKEYNGKTQTPSYDVNDVIDGDIVFAVFGLSNDPSVELSIKNVGTYNIVVSSISNSNYMFDGYTACQFEITPAKIKITFDDKETRFTLAPINRPTITYTITGDLYDDVSELNLQYHCDGINETESGTYPIIASVSNKNYDVEIVSANYIVSGYYYIFYTLPDGSEYIEIVEDGATPVGITKEIYKKPFLSELLYSDELVGNGETDLYIEVTVKSYIWIFYVSIAILGFIILYGFSTRKERRNKMR